MPNRKLQEEFFWWNPWRDAPLEWVLIEKPWRYSPEETPGGIPGELLAPLLHEPLTFKEQMLRGLVAGCAFRTCGGACISKSVRIPPKARMAWQGRSQLFGQGGPSRGEYQINNYEITKPVFISRFVIIVLSIICWTILFCHDQAIGIQPLNNISILHFVVNKFEYYCIMLSQGTDVTEQQFLKLS